jgi:hypothetical protein
MKATDPPIAVSGSTRTSLLRCPITGQRVAASPDSLALEGLAFAGHHHHDRPAVSGTAAALAGSLLLMWTVWDRTERTRELAPRVGRQ